MKLDEQVAEAVRATIAQQILASIDTTARDAILAKSIREAITDYTFKHAIEKAAADKAAEVVKELLASESWTIKIRQTILNGFDDYLKNLRAALPAALIKMLHGDNSSSYDRSAGHILAVWPVKPDSE